MSGIDPTAPRHRVDDDLVRIACVVLEDRMGLRFHDGNRDLLETGLLRAAVQCGLPLSELLRQLCSPQVGDEILQWVVQALTICETYFFRHPEHFAILEREIVPQLLRMGRRGVRAYSAGCATGEEAYSLAMVLAHGGLGLSAHVLGTDINRESLRIAERGVYGKRSLRSSSPLLDRYLLPLRGSAEVSVAPAVRAMTRFAPLNFGDAGALQQLQQAEEFDVIFCRNVLVYFAPHHVRRILEQLRDMLTPGGYLVLSALDLGKPLAGMDAVVIDGVPILRRGLDATPPPRAGGDASTALPMMEGAANAARDERSAVARAATDAGSGPLRADGRSTRDRTTQPAPGLTAATSMAGVKNTTAAAAPAPGAQASGLQAARTLADGGQLKRAAHQLQSLLTRERSPEVLHLWALTQIEQGQRADAEAALLEATQLCPDYVQAHLCLGLLDRPAAQRWVSGRHLGVVLRLLEGRADGDVLPGPEPLQVSMARRLAAVALDDLVRQTGTAAGGTTDGTAGPVPPRGGGAR